MYHTYICIIDKYTYNIYQITYIYIYMYIYIYIHSGWDRIWDRIWTTNLSRWSSVFVVASWLQNTNIWGLCQQPALVQRQRGTHRSCNRLSWLGSCGGSAGAASKSSNNMGKWWSWLVGGWKLLFFSIQLGRIIWNYFFLMVVFSIQLRNIICMD